MDYPALLLLSEVYGTLKGGISTIYRRLATILKEREPNIPVFSAVLDATEEDKEDAKFDRVDLLLPKVESGDERTDPSLHWLTFDHRVKYPHLPSKVRSILGHTDGTGRAACRIKQDLCSEATVVLFIDDIPEDTEQYKGDEKAMGIGKKENSILEDAQKADVVFSIGDRIFDHFKSQFRAIPANKRPQHIKFLPRPSRMFEDANAEYSDAETMVVLIICRVTGAEKLKGLDIAIEALSIVAGKMRVKLRVRGVDKEDLQTTKAILDHCKSANLQITFLPYGTQKDICKGMLQSHLVLMPSRAEPFGLVGLEAIAAGVPVLVSDKSGLADVINKFAPRYHNCIVETDIAGDEKRNADHWARSIEKVLRHCEAEFETAANLKKELLSSRYWEESERQFIDVCTVGVSSARFDDNGKEDAGESQGSSSDEESLNYSILKTSDTIFDEEVLQDPDKFESRLLAFREHVDAALPYFKLSCKAKLRVKRRAKYLVTKVNKVLFSGKRLKSKYVKMVECFKLFCATLKKIEDGCVLCTLEFDGALDLRSFLRGYRDGKLSETLTKELITEEMKQEGGPDLCVDITLLVAMETTRSGDEEEELLQAFRRLSFETPRRHFVDIAMKLGIKLDSMTQSDTMKPTFRSQLVFDALRMWRMREGKAATLSALAKHLRELDLPYLADLVLWTPMVHNLGDVSEERGAVGGQEAIETRRSVYPTVTVDPDIPIIDNKLLHSQLFIGAGAFGVVVKAYHTEWKQDVAIKRISSLQEYSSEQLMYSETSILKRAIQSDHVINLLGSCLEPHVSIVMPYMKNGSLASLLQRVDVPWALRWRMAHEISLGMTFLHRQIPQILHCNLTAENVLLDDEFHVKISGFGSTALMLQTGTSMPVFTPIHASPEVLENSRNEYFVLTTKVDVYSFGVLLWEIMTREKPYAGIEDVVALIYRVVTKGLRPDMTQVPKDSPEEDTVSQLMQKCWSQLPQDRPSFDDCEEHLRDVNKRSSKEDILDAIIYVKLATTEGIGQYKKGEESPLRSMTTRSKVPKERTRVEEEEEEVLYDAYICHCAEDDFVREMVENLESPPFGPEGKGLRLFSFKRDAWPGMPIHDIVIEAIERSRHLVLVLSPEALTSQMCRIEMECAASLPPEESRPKVIPVMYKQTDIPSWLKSMVILDYVNEEKRRKGWFWVKLARAISNP